MSAALIKFLQDRVTGAAARSEEAAAADKLAGRKLSDRKQLEANMSAVSFKDIRGLPDDQRQAIIRHKLKSQVAVPLLAAGRRTPVGLAARLAARGVGPAKAAEVDLGPLEEMLLKGTNEILRAVRIRSTNKDRHKKRNAEDAEEGLKPIRRTTGVILPDQVIPGSVSSRRGRDTLRDKRSKLGIRDKRSKPDAK